MSYPTLDRNARLAQLRSDLALAAALSAGYTDEQAWRVADRARSEARAGIRNDTAGFAGQVVEGTGPVLIRSYTGNQIDPLAGGIESSSTLD